MNARTAPLLLLGWALAACSPDTSEEVPLKPPAPASLTPLTATEIEAHPLEGELGCAFTSGSDTLLIAMGIVADEEGHAQGLAKWKMEPQLMIAEEPGGFDSLIGGGAFTAPDLRISVTLLSEEPVGGGESPPYAARLDLQPSGGVEQAIAGRWTCGP